MVNLKETRDADNRHLRRRAGQDEQAKRMAIICWSSDLDRVWPTLILGTTGAASGLDVDVFFTF